MKVQVPAVQNATPFSVPEPVTVTLTAVRSPFAAPQLPPTSVTVALIDRGKVLAPPLTVVRVMTGAVRSRLMVRALEPVFPAVSVCAAVTL